ncbi:MAG: DNA-formamidopyrimidine glycosylase, partial [Actinobacteria bacterium]|nr:DNA-formamidopyrimidine glycosylase [Actinomycetota bacterium]
MPELPEVETIRRELEHEIVGRRIKAVQVLPGASRSIRRHADALEFQTGLDGHKLTGIGRRGKYLLFNLDTGSILVVHLGMSGQLLLIKSNKEPPSRHTRVTLLFSQGGELRFVDPRTFGEMFVTRPEKIEEDVPELAHLGFDPLMQVMSWTRFATMLQQHSGKLKPLLMDQRFVAGIGNIYADEILFAAGIEVLKRS